MTSLSVWNFNNVSHGNNLNIFKLVMDFESITASCLYDESDEEVDQEIGTSISGSKKTKL